jgi:hypothetical protein
LQSRCSEAPLGPLEGETPPFVQAHSRAPKGRIPGLVTARWQEQAPPPATTCRSTCCSTSSRCQDGG